jgi:hypothetical protein
MHVPEIIDTPWDTTSHLSVLRNAGVTAVIRYINHKNSTKLPQKCVAPPEAAAIHAAGLQVALVFEQRNNQPSVFSAAEGAKAATRAYDYSTRILNRPAGRPIYFAVDFDAVKASDLIAVRNYFQAVNQFLATRPGGVAATPVGVYGSGFVGAALHAAGLASFFWIAQSTGWSGYHKAIASHQWHLLQGFKKKDDGINLDYDPDFSNAALPDFGAY